MSMHEVYKKTYGEENQTMQETLDRTREAIEKAGFSNVHEIIKELKVRTEERDQLQTELDEAYAEIRKQRPARTAVYDRKVWDRAENALNRR